MADPLLPEDPEELFRERANRTRGDGHLHDLAVAERAVIRELLHVVVADAALIAEARATGVAGRRADLRAAPRQRRLLMQRELVLDVPEAATPKIDVHQLIIDREGRFGFCEGCHQCRYCGY